MISDGLLTWVTQKIDIIWVLQTWFVFKNYCLLVSMRAEFEYVFHTLQISSEEILTKKEQLSEARQTMQLFLAKNRDKYVGFH